jgi:hypothetical protein
MSGAWSQPRRQLETVKWVGAFRRFSKKLPAAARSNARNSDSLDRCADEGWLCVRNLTDDLSKLQASLEGSNK